MIKRVLLSGSLIALTAAVAPAPDASAFWGTFQYDAQHTGKAPVNGPSVPSIKWSYAAPQQVWANPDDPTNIWNGNFGFTAGAMEGPDGSIYAGSDDGNGYAFDPRNGSIKHIFYGVGVCCAPPVVDKDGNIYFAGNGLWAFNPDYTLKFYYPDGGVCCGAITIAADGTVVVGNGYLHAFDPANLVFTDPSNPDPVLSKIVAPKWYYDDKGLGESVAFSTDSSTVYAMSYTELVAFDLTNLTVGEDGKSRPAIKWAVPIVNDGSTVPLVDSINKKIYIGDDQQLISVNPDNGAKTPVVSLPGKQISRLALNGTTIIATAVPVVVDTVAGTRTFDQDSDSTLYAINTVANSIISSVDLLGNGEPEIMPIIDNSGAIYVSTIQKADGIDYMFNFYMFNLSKTAPAVLSPIWTYSKGTTFSSDSRFPILGMDGTLYNLIDGAIVAFGGTADISASLTATPNPAFTNGVLSFTAAIANAGPDKATATTVKLTLPTGFSSSSNFILPSNCSQASPRVINCALGELTPGASAPVTISGKAPATVGSVSITATAKSDMPDPNPANNTATLKVPVNAPAPVTTCDLIVSAAPTIATTSGTTTTSVTRGTTYNFKATVKNQGTGTCAASTVAFYLSSDAVINSSDKLIGTAAVTSLAAGASKSITLSKSVATSVSATTYYLGADADSAKVVAETNETNNTKATSTKGITVK